MGLSSGKGNGPTGPGGAGRWPRGVPSGGGLPQTAWTRAREWEAWRQGASRAWPCPPAPLPCAATRVAVPVSSAPLAPPGFVSAPTRGGAAGCCPLAVRHTSTAIGGGVVCRWGRCGQAGLLAAGAAVRPVPVGAGGGLSRRKHCGGPLRWRAAPATAQAPIPPPQRAGQEDPHHRPRGHDRERAGQSSVDPGCRGRDRPARPDSRRCRRVRCRCRQRRDQGYCREHVQRTPRRGRAARPDGVHRSPAADERGHWTARL